MDKQAAGVRSPKHEVLEVFQKRHEQGSDPFGDAFELFRHMKKQGSSLEDLDVGVAIGRLFCEGQLQYALDGIRLIS